MPRTDDVELIDKGGGALVQLHRLGLNLLDVHGDLRLMDRHDEINWNNESLRSGLNYSEMRFTVIIAISSIQHSSLCARLSLKG